MRKNFVQSTLAAMLMAVLLTSNGLSVDILVDGINATITRHPLSDSTDVVFPTEDVGVVYDSLLFEGNVETPTTGPGGAINEDYVSTITSPSTLEQFIFVGGVETADNVIFFNYFDTDSQFVDGFGVLLPSAGLTNIWTITLTDPTSVSVPAAGFLQLQADDGTNNPGGLPTNAAWRFKDVPPAIGSTTGDVYRMQMTVIPEPACASLLLLGTLGLVIRRRR